MVKRELLKKIRKREASRNDVGRANKKEENVRKDAAG